MCHGLYIYYSKAVKEKLKDPKETTFGAIKKARMTYPFSIMLSGIGVFLVNQFLMKDKSRPLTIGFGIIACTSFIW